MPTRLEAIATSTVQPLLSICIATFNRAEFIVDTLAAIAPQLDSEVEVVIIDGASSDATPETISAFIAAQHIPVWNYYRAATNSGVDADYDLAIGRATGRYCWLLPDDDLPRPGAVATIKRALADAPDLIVANARFMSPDLREVLEAPRLKIEADQSFDSANINAFIEKSIFYLTYIGGCVIRREFWMARERQRYHGTGFAHIGVICQSPLLTSAKIIAEPLIDYRHGNALWRPRSFEIWMLGWPQFVASLTAISPQARKAAHDPSPWRILQLLTYHLAVGKQIDPQLWHRFTAATGFGLLLPLANALYVLPHALTSFLVCCYACLRMRSNLVVCYDLFTSPNAGPATRTLARLTGLPRPLQRAVASHWQRQSSKSPIASP